MSLIKIRDGGKAAQFGICYSCGWKGNLFDLCSRKARDCCPKCSSENVALKMLIVEKKRDFSDAS